MAWRISAVPSPAPAADGTGARSASLAGGLAAPDVHAEAPRTPEPRIAGPAGADPRQVDQAIARVLQAEREARVAIEQAAREAEAQVAAARRRVQGIAERAALRAARVHRAVEQDLATRLAQIERASAALAREANDSTDPQRLSRAVRQLAHRLTTSGAS